LADKEESAGFGEEALKLEIAEKYHHSNWIALISTLLKGRVNNIESIAPLRQCGSQELCKVEVPSTFSNNPGSFVKFAPGALSGAPALLLGD